MNQQLKTGMIWMFRFLLVAAIIGFFLKGNEYWKEGIPYVSITSSNPNPSEDAKIMGPLMMRNSQTCLFFSVACFALLVISFLKITRRFLAKENETDYVSSRFIKR
jgi:hypothetical protein